MRTTFSSAQTSSTVPTVARRAGAGKGEPVPLSTVRLAQRILSAVAVAALLAGFTLALLPVSVSSSFGPSVGCDPSGTATMEGGSTVGLSHYVGAFEVWLIPDSVNPPQTESTTYNPAANQAVCRHAAQSRMIPAVILLGVGMCLLIFRNAFARRISTGRRSVPRSDLTKVPPLEGQSTLQG